MAIFTILTKMNRPPFAMILVWVVVAAVSAPRAQAAHPPEDKLDCSVYETKTSELGLALKAGNFLLNYGPQLSFARTTGVVWDKAVHGLIARYVELCGRYNAGLVDKTEYEQRLRAIDGVYKEMQETETQLYQATRRRSRDSQSELDELVGHKVPSRADPDAVTLEAKVHTLAERVAQLEGNGTPLRPATPCVPSDGNDTARGNGQGRQHC